MAGSAKRRLDLGTVLGLAIGAGAILGGHILEHGKARDVLGGPAAIIVLGGCLGATLVATPMSLLADAVRRLPELLFEERTSYESMVEEIVGFSSRARKNGIVSLESEALSLPDPFLRKALMLAVDGVDINEIRSTMELEIRVEEERRECVAKVYEAAGGFAPTIGIIGAVLGLILVMGKIEDMNAVGQGIASAFVATIYGVGSANLLFLPAAAKIRLRARTESERRELMLEGVIGLAEGLNPKLIGGKLEAYLRGPATQARARNPKVLPAAARAEAS